MPELEDHERKVYGPELEIPELGREPAYHPYFRHLNTIISALAHLVGKYGNKSVLLQADADGKLLVNTGGGGGGTWTPFTAATAPDHRYLQSPNHLEFIDLGSAAPRIVSAQLSYDTAATGSLLYDDDTGGSEDRLLGALVVAHELVRYATGRYLTYDLAGGGVIIVSVLVWDL